MFATVPEICAVSEETLAAHRLAQLRALSDRFRGMGFTWEAGIWSGSWGDGHGHEALGMGVLWLDVADCAACLEHDWPGWHITGSRGEGYGASDGTRSFTFATRSQLVCPARPGHREAPVSTVEATAVYRADEPAELVVTEDGNPVGQRVPYQHAGPVPSVRALVTTEWSAVPGARWEEHPGGCWSIRVFRHQT